MKTNGRKSKSIRLGTHGENYGNWMSAPVFYMVGALVVLCVISHFIPGMRLIGVLALIAAVVVLILLAWITWIRRQYAFGGGGMMEKIHEVLLSYLDFDGNGTLLEVGCGSGALSIRAALSWPEAEVTGIDYWGAVYNYSQIMCESNARSEGVYERCSFLHGDARKLDFPDETFDAVVSNYVYHNINGTDKQALLLESLRVLKKGGVFALNDDMKPWMYGDVEEFAKRLRKMGYREVRIIDTAQEAFGSHRRATLMMLGNSRMIVGQK